MQSGDSGLCPAIQAALEVDRARTGDHVPNPVSEDGLGKNGRRAGTVADDVAGLLGGLPQHLSTQVLLRVFEIEFLGNGDAIVADDWRSPRLLNQDGLRLRTKRYAYGIREQGCAAQDFFTSG